MSEQSDKPFSCGIPGCGQRFANHDHLTTHQQKHEFSLKFKAGESLLVDQTPTPTRFLRNLEESGLFQELETNPFDQDFKQATNGPKEGSGSRQSSGKPTTSAEGKGCEAVETPPVSAGTTVTRGTTTIPVAPPPNLANPEKAVPMASAPAHVSNTAATAITKQKLLQNIQLKEQQKLLEQQLAAHLGQNPELLAQALKGVIPVADSPSKSTTIEQQGTEVTFVTPGSDSELGGSAVKRKRGRKPDDEDPEVKRAKFLERNRAAASRCRAKKKQWVDSLEKKAKELEVVNQALQQEVLMLRSEVQQLKSILIAHKDCPLIVHRTKTGESSGGDTVEVPSAQAVSVTAAGVTLLSQLANMPSMSPLIASPVPSVGSVVPNIGTSSSVQPTTIIITTNGVAQQALEVGKDVEISADSETQTIEQ